MKKILLLSLVILCAIFALASCKAHEHSYSYTRTIWDPSCQSDGTEYDYCSCNQIIEERKKVLGGKIWCEKNGDKGYLAKALREKGERVVDYHEDTNKYIKIVTHLKGDWSNVVFVKGTDPEYIEQILDYNEFAEHDDAPYSASCTIRLLHPQKNAEDRVSGFGY